VQLVVFLSPAHGHVNPTLPIVRELVRRGVTVHYFCTEPFRSKVEASGARFESYGEVGFYRERSAKEGPVRHIEAATGLLRTTLALLPALTERARDLGADGILFDSMCLWGKYVAERLRLPAISSCAIFPVHSRNLRDLGQSLPAAIPWRDIPAIARAAIAFRAVRARVQRAYGVRVPELHDFYANNGDITIAYNARALLPGAGRFDERWKFVGSTVADPTPEPGYPWDQMTGQPLVYVSLGTLFNDQVQFFRDCLQAFGARPVQVILSIGDSVRPGDLGPLPANVFVRPYNPQLEILQRARVFVTHGGMNSVNESMWYGVPMLVVPQSGDQPFIGPRIAAIGAGLLLQPGAVTPERLWSLTERLLSEPAFAAASRAFGDQLRAAGGYRRAADEIVQLVEGGQRNSL
jgi:MGT family glycosyltransferase